MGNAQLEITGIADSLKLPRGVVSGASMTQLVFAPAASESDILKVGMSLLRTRSFMSWALGSCFAAIIDRHAQALRRDANSTERALDEAESFAREFAESHNVQPKEFREILAVSRFYAPADLGELTALTFDHFREAMWGVASESERHLERAIAFLRTAHTNNWKVPELRRHIRTSRAQVSREERQEEFAHYSAVFDFMRFAKRELPSVHTYSAERARTILDDLGEDAQLYVDALRMIAAGRKPLIPPGTGRAGK